MYVTTKWDLQCTCAMIYVSEDIINCTVVTLVTINISDH